MYNNKLLNLLYNMMEWIMRIAYINLLWILFTALGLVVGGAFPATVGVYTVMRQWRVKRADSLRVWKTFWKAYRSSFVKVNIIGYILLIVGFILYMDIRVFHMHSGIFYLVLTYLTSIFFIIHIAMWMFLFPVYVHYELKSLDYLKQTFYIVMLRPLNVLASAAIIAAVYYFMLYVPFSILVFGMGITSLVTT